MSAEIQTHFGRSKAGRLVCGWVVFGKHTVVVKAHDDGTFMLVQVNYFEVPMERSEITDLSQFLATAATSSLDDHYVRWLRISSQGEDWFANIWRAEREVGAWFKEFGSGIGWLSMPPEVATIIREIIETLLAAELPPTQ